MINQQWASTDWSFREELKNVLYGYLIEKGNTAPHFIRTKYAKLLIAVAKQDWPTNYPNFLNNILEVCLIIYFMIVFIIFYYVAAVKI